MFARLKTRLRSTMSRSAVKLQILTRTQSRISMFVALMVSDTRRGVPEPETRKGSPAYFPRILLMIPTLNEEEAIEALVSEARSVGFTNILVVDGCSTDRTRDIAKEAGARVLLQDFGKGKGCGVRTGMREFLFGDSDILCIIDGDGTNIPVFLTQMIEQIKSGQADVVLGSRTRGPRERDAMDRLSLASNLTVSFILGAKFGRLFTDIQTGYWTFTRNAVERVYPNIRSTGFEIELELFVKILKEGLKVREIPVGFRRRKGLTKFSFAQRIRNLYCAFRLLAS
jgi:glycosyltransferase involved in cell wall biosynthesis